MTASSATAAPGSKRTLLDMTPYQWTVLLAAWMGWGFDVFDGLLFNFVAPKCVPDLLNLEFGTPEAKMATLQWAGALTSVLLVGWGIGGIAFGRLADKIGRTRTLLFTILLYSGGTAACAFAPNIYFLGLFRFIASLGIGGEWAAGAAMVAEVVPEKRRVEAGAFLYTAAPMGIFLAILVDWLAAKYAPSANSWRIVFLSGLIPCFFALIVRAFLKEPERWKEAGENAVPSIRELFSPQLWRVTLSGFCMATIVMLTWWSINAFLPTLATMMAKSQAATNHLPAAAETALITTFKTNMSGMFSLGGLVGTLLTIPLAKTLGRRAMFGLYFTLGLACILFTYGPAWSAETRILLHFFLGLTIFGIFGAFTFYLPELFPTRLRCAGSGLCYNGGRFLTALGPYVVGQISSRGQLDLVLRVLMYVAVVPLVGLALLPFVIETKGRELED